MNTVFMTRVKHKKQKPMKQNKLSRCLPKNTAQTHLLHGRQTAGFSVKSYFSKLNDKSRKREKECLGLDRVNLKILTSRRDNMGEQTCL